MTQPNLFNQPPDQTDTETQAIRNKREEERKRDYQIWLDSMSESERADFQRAFNEL